MSSAFIFDSRLGIHVPSLEKSWELYSLEDQELVLMKWEKIRGRIPERIFELEAMINEKQNELSEEDHFGRSCLLNSEISDLASIINDLWIWYRSNETVTSMNHG